MNSFHTDPFNKYLYSGAFYIQVANCYHSILEWIPGAEPGQREVLVNMIQNLWLQTTMNAYSSTLSGLGLVNTTTVQANDSPNFVRLAQMLNRIAPQIINDVADRVSKQVDGTLTLQEFWEIWIETCSKVHAELINSGEFIDYVTELVNLSIKTSAETMKVAESGNG